MALPKETVENMERQLEAWYSARMDEERFNRDILAHQLAIEELSGMEQEAKRAQGAANETLNSIIADIPVGDEAEAKGIIARYVGMAEVESAYTSGEEEL